MLFAVMEWLRGQGVRVLLQSSLRPVVEANSGGIRFLRPPKDVSGRRFFTGQMLRFRLVANPTKKIRDANNPNRAIRVPHVGEDHRIAWLQRKLDGAAKLVEAATVPERPWYFAKKGMHGKIQAVTYTGILEVRDAIGFENLLKNGIGPAKGLGCGLMLVAKV